MLERVSGSEIHTRMCTAVYDVQNVITKSTVNHCFGKHYLLVTPTRKNLVSISRIFAQAICLLKLFDRLKIPSLNFVLCEQLLHLVETKHIALPVQERR